MDNRCPGYLQQVRKERRFEKTLNKPVRRFKNVKQTTEVEKSQVNALEQCSLCFKPQLAYYCNAQAKCLKTSEKRPLKNAGQPI